jgi:hypothetical protein
MIYLKHWIPVRKKCAPDKRISSALFKFYPSKYFAFLNLLLIYAKDIFKIIFVGNMLRQYCYFQNPFCGQYVTTIFLLDKIFSKLFV